MGNVSLLKEAAPDPRADADPLRAALEIKIKEAAKIRAAAERHKAGIQRTFDATVAAEAELEKARASVARAQEAHIAALSHAAASGTKAAPSKVKAARQFVVDCEMSLTLKGLRSPNSGPTRLYG
jgi:hypothetical protein